jgi:hypothetical protein
VSSTHPVASISIHAEHEVEVTTYGLGYGGQNLAVECLDCQEVIADADLSGKATFVEIYKAFSAILTRMTFETLSINVPDVAATYTCAGCGEEDEYSKGTVVNSEMVCQPCSELCRECPDCSETEGKCTECKLTEGL